VHITSVSSFVRCVAFLLLGGMALIWATPAHAEPDPLAKPIASKARAHLDQGNKLYAIRAFDEAIAQYKAGALLEDTPVFTYNLAQAYRITGRYQEALWYYERFMNRTEPTGPLREAIERFTSQMKAEIERSAMKEAPTNAAPAPEEQQAMANRLSLSERPEPEPWFQDRTGWALAASGVILTASAVYFLFDAKSLDSEAGDELREVERSDLKDRAQTRRILGYALGAVGVGSLGAGVIKLAIHGGASSSASVAFAGSF
jgi:tetratricopeptide (TPR) repeat protein